MRLPDSARSDVWTKPTDPDGATFEIRFNSSDETHSIWRQPNDLAVAHSAAVLQNLGSWSRIILTPVPGSLTIIVLFFDQTIPKTRRCLP